MKNNNNDIFSSSQKNTDNTQHQYSMPVQPADDKFIPPEVPDDPLKDFVHDDDHVVLDTASAEKGQESIQEQKKSRIRKKKRPDLRKRHYPLAIIMVIAVVFFVWLFLRLAPVSFGTVVVDGNEKMTAEAVYHSSGIKDRVNVVQLSPATMKENLSHDLRIASVGVTREFPATIRVTIEERKAAAVIATMYGFAIVDKDGVVIQLGPQIKGASVPILTGKKMDTLLLGDTISDPSILAVLTYLQSLSPEYLQHIAEVNVGNSQKITAYTTDSIPIYLGSGDNPEERAHMTEELLQEIQGNHLSVAYIDTDIKAPLVKSK